MLDTLMTDGQKVVCFFHCWYRVLIFLGFTMYSYFLICEDYIYLTVGIRTLFPQLIFFFEMYLTTFLTIIARYYLFYQVMSLGLRLNFFRLTNMSTLMSVRVFFWHYKVGGFNFSVLWSHYLGMSHFDDTASFVCSSLVCFFLLERKS